jgi:hypothetical protein
MVQFFSLFEPDFQDFNGVIFIVIRLEPKKEFESGFKIYLLESSYHNDILSLGYSKSSRKLKNKGNV